MFPIGAQPGNPKRGNEGIAVWEVYQDYLICLPGLFNFRAQLAQTLNKSGASLL